MNETASLAPLPPGSTIGIVGGGQLGRMTALAAAALGYRCHILTPEHDSPAAQVSAGATVAAYDDVAALEQFAAAVDVVTFEFENIPYESVRQLSERVPVRPGWHALHIAQDRLREKDWLASLGIPTAAYRRVDGPEALAAAAEELGCPAVLKTVRMGYDGKGQVKLNPGDDPHAAWKAMGSDLGILESFVAFDREISVVVARGADGSVAAFEPVENRHVNHILDTTIAPAPIADAISAEAAAIARRIVEALDYVGVMGVEMFLSAEGRVLVNELAPRPHNSGHWTIDACYVSQFEQVVRAVCGLPLGDPARHSDAVMTNLLGDAVHTWPTLVAEPGACLHLYGKAEARAGRKMGHVTRVSPRRS